jgi:hypothetical protein
MTQANPFSSLSRTVLVAACLFGALQCGSNQPSVNGTGGGSATGGGAASGGGSASGGGASGGGGAASGGGAATGGGTGTGGGASGGGAAAGGGSGTGGGASGDGGGTAAGGGSASGGGSGADAGAFSPLCSNVTTGLGANPSKGVACTATDPAECWKTCGPQGIGYKSETCTAGAYVEQSGCTFPLEGNYACYKIPATIDSSCPATTPQASQACTVAACTLCNVGGQYLDSSAASKTGYCVCVTGDAGTGKWSCASSTAWPCPAGNGC